VFTSRSSRAHAPNKANLGFPLPLLRPGLAVPARFMLGTTCFLGLFWMYKTSISIVIFPLQFGKMQAMSGEPSNPMHVSTSPNGNFAKRPFTINGAA